VAVEDIEDLVGELPHILWDIGGPSHTHKSPLQLLFCHLQQPFAELLNQLLAQDW
jgi:hypothetical protein